MLLFLVIVSLASSI